MALFHVNDAGEFSSKLGAAGNPCKANDLPGEGWIQQMAAAKAMLGETVIHGTWAEPKQNLTRSSTARNRYTGDCQK